MPRHNKERFVLDPDGDVTLVFNSKDAIVSKPHDLNILTKEKSNAMKVAHWLEARKALELSTETCMIEDKADRDNVYMIPAATDHVAPTVVHYAESMSSGRYTTVNGLPAPRLRLYNCGEADIEVRISSKHFALKSRIFRKILASNLQERPAAQNMEDIRVHLPGDHIDGMLVILKVLHYDFDHAANGQVNPRGLMQLALMVDKYKLAPTLKFWTRKWHDEMRISDRSFKWWPSRRSPDVMSWVWLLHALQLDKELAVMENIAWNVMTETLFECKLPMDNILEAMKKKRMDAISLAISRLNGIIRVLLESKEDRDKIVLDQLLKEIKSLGLVYPWPEPPYCGWTVIDLTEKLEEICEKKEKLHEWDELGSVWKWVCDDLDMIAKALC